MNRQPVYIIQAFLLLLIGFAGVFLVSRFSQTKQTSNYYSSTQIDYETSIEPIINSGSINKGKNLFMSKCASCHNLFKDGTGPGLLGFEERGPWVERKNLYEWIKNPAAFIAKNEYAKQLKKVYSGMVMPAFPDITNEEIDAICEYINHLAKSASLPIAER